MLPVNLDPKILSRESNFQKISFLEILRKSDQAVKSQAKVTEIFKNIMNFL